MGDDIHGEPIPLENFSLADSSDEFWRLTRKTQPLSEEQEEDFVSFIERCLLHAAPLNSPSDVAWFLASYARDARRRLQQADLSRLSEIRDALESMLGIQFTGARGLRFFHATIVQTLFYGIFSAWVLWHRENPERKDIFIWHSTGYYLRVPVIQIMFERLALPSNVGSLRLTKYLNLATRIFNRIDRRKFFNIFDDELAIEHFYEPFLKAYDSKLSDLTPIKWTGS